MKLSCFIAVAFAGCVNAWWDQGHLLTARRASDILSKENPAVLKAALAMLAPLKKNYSSITFSEKDHAFIECATFADVIKGKGYDWQKNWHFIDQPVIPDTSKTIADFPKFQPDTVSNVDALENLTNFLMNRYDYKDSTYYQQIKSNFPAIADQQSFALRLVIHYTGDIHQPLHATAEVSDTYPKGDAGGNFEHIPDSTNSGVTNLHSVWDSVGYTYTGFAKLPFTADTWSTNGSEVAKMVPNYPIDAAKVHGGDFQQWAKESYEMSKDHVYPNFTAGVEPSAAYKAQAEDNARSRIMYGGRRLADLMVQIFGDNQVFLQ